MIELNKNSLRYYSLYKELNNNQRLLIPDTTEYQLIATDLVKGRQYYEKYDKEP